MSDSKPEGIWFPAKRYGWGWGPPVTWQGWVVMVVFILVLGVGTFYFPPERRPIGFAAWTIGDGLALMLVCWWKGERPRWRWGDELDSDERKV